MNVVCCKLEQLGSSSGGGGDTAAARGVSAPRQARLVHQIPAPNGSTYTVELPYNSMLVVVSHCIDLIHAQVI